MNPLLWVRAAIISASVAAIFSAGWSWNGARWEAKYTNLDETYKAYEADVQRAADEQLVATAKHEKDDLVRKGKADEENAKTHATLTVALNSLRVAADRAGRGSLPSAPAASSRPDLACYDRAELGRAYGALVAEVRGLADEGTAATVDLDTARRWAQNPTGVQP